MSNPRKEVIGELEKEILLAKACDRWDLVLNLEIEIVGAFSIDIGHDKAPGSYLQDVFKPGVERPSDNPYVRKI